MNREVCEHGSPLALRCDRCDRCESMWEEGRAWQSQAGGWWPADQEPSTVGLYVVRDSKGNVEVATWLCDWNGKNGEWTRELRDVDRDNIVAWLRLPEFKPC